MTMHFVNKFILFFVLINYSLANEDVCDASDNHCGSSEHLDKSDIYKKGKHLSSI